MSLKMNKSIPGMVVQGEEDNRLSMFEGSNAYNPEAPGIMPKLAKGADPFASIDLSKGIGEGSRGGKIIGHTRSGKPIYDTHHESHSSFSTADHADAHSLHQEVALTKIYQAKHVSALLKQRLGKAKKGGDPNAIRQAQAKYDKHRAKMKAINVPTFDKSLADICDSIVKGIGEGSRGGKIIGHTRSGKPIYDTHDHESHSSFSTADHADAHVANQEAALKVNTSQHPDGSGAKRDAQKEWKRLQYENSNAHAGKTSEAEIKQADKKMRGDKALRTKRAQRNVGADDSYKDEFRRVVEGGIKRIQDSRKSMDAEGTVSENGEDPKLKRHKKQFDKMRALHENMPTLQKKSMRGERVMARLKKAMVEDIKEIIKGYGEENLVNTHGEQFMSDADKQVLDYLRSIERIDIDLCSTHNPPVPRSYSHKSMEATNGKNRLMIKAFD